MGERLTVLDQAWYRGRERGFREGYTDRPPGIRPISTLALDALGGSFCARFEEGYVVGHSDGRAYRRVKATDGPPPAAMFGIEWYTDEGR